MKTNTDKIIELGKLALAFGRTMRATKHEDGKRFESDTTHTVMLGWIALELANSLDLPRYERGMIAQYVLVHDMVEAKCSDTNTFDISPEARAKKEEREQEAIEELLEEFGNNSWLMHLLVSYEKQQAFEARFVRYLDKAMPKITHILNNCTTIKEMNKTHEDLVRAHKEQLDSLNKQYPELEKMLSPVVQSLMEESEEAYWR